MHQRLGGVEDRVGLVRGDGVRSPEGDQAHAARQRVTSPKASARNELLAWQAKPCSTISTPSAAAAAPSGSTHPPDVLPAFVAELDVALAPPVRDALLEAIELGDARLRGARRPVRGLRRRSSARRFGWAPDPARMQLVPDVMAGIVEVLRVLTAPGDGVVDQPAGLSRRSSPGSPRRAARVVEVPLAGGELDLDGLDRAFAGGARALLLCNPHNPTGRVLARERAGGGRRRSPRATTCSSWPTRSTRRSTLPGARHTPFGALGDSRSVVLTSASKAFNTRRAEVRARDRGLGGGRASSSPRGCPTSCATAPGCSA